MAASLPVVGDSLNAWGALLNAFLLVAHNPDGTLIVPPFANPMNAQGDLIEGGIGGEAIRLPIGANGQYLSVVNGTLSWQQPPGGFANPMTVLGDVIVGAANGVAARLAIGATNQVLTVVGGVPTWANAVSGFANPMTSIGDIITGTTGGAAQRLAAGATGQVLTIVSGSPAWATNPAGFANPMTTTGDIITGATGGTPQRLGIGSAGQVLSVSGGQPAWTTPTSTYIPTIPVSNDLTGATDTVALNAAIAANQKIQLEAGIYYLNAPLFNNNPDSIISGIMPVTQSGDNMNTNFGGTILQAVAGFNKGALAHPSIVVLGDGGGVNTCEGPGIERCMIYGGAGPATLDGIGAYGNIQAITIGECGIFKATGNGLSFFTNISLNNKPDGGNIHTGVCQDCTGIGVYCDGADLDFDTWHCQNSGSDGWQVYDANNSLRGCRGDHSTGNGFYFSSVSGPQTQNHIHLDNCYTQGNQKNGCLIQSGNVVTGTAVSSPVVANSCTFQFDGGNNGAGGGGYAGIALQGVCVGIFTGCTVSVGTNEFSGGSPEYGIATAQLGSGNGVPQLVQIAGGFYGSQNTSGAIPQINDAGPATLLSATFHGWTGSSLTASTPITLYQKNPL